MPPPDLTSARLFIAVVEEGSIAAAARRENTAASAVSKRMADLEARFGRPLLRRHPSGVEATAAGTVFLRHARDILRQAAELEAAMRALGTQVEGHIRLSASETSLVGILPDSLGRFLATNPGITIALDEGLNRDVLQALEAGEADLGVLAAEVLPPGLWSHPCFRDQLVAVMRPDHPLAAYPGVTFAELFDHEVIGQDPRGALGALLRHHAARLGRRFRSRVSADGYDVVCRLAQQGLGIGIVAEGSAVFFAPGMGLARVAILDEWARRAHRVCGLRPEAGLSRPARLLLDHLRQEARAAGVG